MIKIINITTIILTICSAVYLFMIADKTAKALKIAIIYFALSVLIGTTMHAFIEILEVYSYITPNISLILVPVLVLVGSVFLIIGTYKLHNVIARVYKSK